MVAVVAQPPPAVDMHAFAFGLANSQKPLSRRTRARVLLTKFLGFIEIRFSDRFPDVGDSLRTLSVALTVGPL